jgi:signal transduction histidine kinase/ActR/RegA family two-component response regulator
MTTTVLEPTPDFRVLFEASPALLMVLAPDSQFTILGATDAYLRATLTQRESMVGRALFDVFPDNPDDPGATGTSSLRASLQRVLRDRRSDTMAVQKYDIRRPESEGGGFEERFWSPVNTPVFAADGSCRYIIHRVEDVTEFVRLNQQRQEQARRDGGERLGADWKEVEVFHRAQELGQAAREAFARLQSQLERLSLLQQITRAIGERQDLPSICQIVIRTIEERMPLDFGCIGQYSQGDSRLSVMGMGLKQDELAAALSTGERAQVDLGEEGLARWVRGRMVYEPDLGLLQFEFARRMSAAGLRSMVAVPLCMDSQTFGLLLAARREANSFSSGDCEFLEQLAEHVALAANNSQLYSALHVAYEDLRSTQQVALQQERLRALGQMASGIAHDINNSITPAALYLDALLENSGELPREAVDRLQTVQRAVHDVAATVARMREFYRQRETQRSFAPVQLNELVKQVVDLTRARWSDMPLQRGVAIDLRTELASRLPPVMGIDHELREALINLVFNAVDAMPGGGTLILRTRREEGNRVVVEVTDTGVGMDDEARRRCLEPFYTTKGERGTGLGLAMVFGVAQRHAADIDIDSAIGAGTTVRMGFAAGADAGEQPPLSLAQVSAPRRILIIDDDPVLLRSLHEALELDGHSVVMAHGGEEGIERFRAALPGKQPFDVVFTDLGMPYVDGRQVAVAVKALSPATPVVMLTGWGQHMNEDGESPPNVDQLLGKPPRLRELRAALVSLTANATADSGALKTAASA